MTGFAKGDLVQCPTDRGDAPYRGKVTFVGAETQTNIHGTEYQWVTVETLDGKSRHVWPSHRIVRA